jgi:hypothetical protein
MTTWTSRTKRFLIGTAAAAAVGGALLALHRPAPASPLANTAEAAQPATPTARFAPGARRTYSLDLGQHIRIESASNGRTQGAIAAQGAAEPAPARPERAAENTGTYGFGLRGRLVFTVLRGVGGVIWIEGAIQEPSTTFQTNGADAQDPAARAAFERGLARPFYVEADRTGAAHAMHFDRDVDPIARGLIKTAVALTQVAGRTDDLRSAASWTANESDPTGEYVASYERDTTRRCVQKSRTRYTRVAAADGLVPVENAGAVTSALKSAITLDAGLWPASIDGTDSLRIEPGGGLPSIDASASIRLDLRETTLDGAHAAAFAGVPESYERTTIASAGDSPDAARQDRELVAGATLASLRTQLERVARAEDKGQERAHLHDQLAALFRLDPAATREAAAGTLAGQDPATARVVIGALGTAGTPEAQDALAALAESDTLDTKLRANALANLGLVEAPTTSTLEALDRQTASDTRSVRSTATLALGNAARSLEAGGDESADTTVLDLLERLDGATNPADQALYLRALGNAGDPRALPAIETALASPEERVRSAAAEALRFIADPRADVLLSKVLVADLSPTVRRSAVLAATFREITPLLPAMDAALGKDGDERVRMDVVAALGRARKAAPAVIELLRGTAEHDPSADIRKRAAAYLAS